MSDTTTFPKPPDPLWLAQVAGQVRALMPLVGGIVGTLGITLPALTDAQIADYISAAMVLFGFASYAWTAIWSYRQKAAAERAKRDAEVSAAKASAEATMAAGRAMPVTVTVTPAGLDNEAVRVRPAELAAAPSVPPGATPSPAPRAVA